MKVTDKNYQIEDNFVDLVEIFLKRKEKNWDHLLLYDGEEGVGKTTCAIHHAYYIAHKMGKRFSHENIFFDPEAMMKFAAETEGEVIMWDEAAFGGMSAQWQNQIQQKLVMCLMTARKKRHTWLFLIPQLHTLNFYFIKRAVGIIHVYSEDDITRGKYVYIGKRRKIQTIIPQILNSTRKRMISFKKYSWRGAFGQDALVGKIIDEDAYETAKDNAITKAFSGDSGTNKWKESAMKHHLRLYLLAQYCMDNYDLSQSQIGKIINGSHNIVTRGRELYEKHSDLLGKPKDVLVHCTT